MNPKWMPEVGSVIAVALPQEIIRGEVLKYLDDDTIEAKLNVQSPLSKSHNYRFKQVIKVMRRKAEPSGDKWATEDVD